MSNKDFQNGFVLGLASGGVVEVENCQELENLENLIDQSGVLPDTNSTISDKIKQLIDRTEDEKIWYDHMQKSTGMFDYLFSGFQGTKLPRMTFDNAYTLSNTFYNIKNVESIDFYINSSKCTMCRNTFGESNIKRIVGIDTSNCTSANNMFTNSAIEVIERAFDFSKVTNTTNAFGRSGKLKEVYFVEETIYVSIAFNSSVLSAESIQSIIGGLATVTTAQTLTLNSAIALTDEQKATINAKGWTLAQ